MKIARVFPSRTSMTPLILLRKTKMPKGRKRGKMNTEAKELTINGVTYIPKGEQLPMAKEFNGMKYVIVRTYSAGVFAGYLAARKGQEVVMRNARRLWYWDGASSLSQLAMLGTSKPQNCKFPCAVDKIELLQAIEIIDCTEQGKKSIEGVVIWKQ